MKPLTLMALKVLWLLCSAHRTLRSKNKEKEPSVSNHIKLNL